MLTCTSKVCYNVFIEWGISPQTLIANEEKLMLFQTLNITPANIHDDAFVDLVNGYWGNYLFPLDAIDNGEHLDDDFADYYGERFSQLAKTNLAEWRQEAAAVYQRITSTPGYYPGAEADMTS